MVGDTDAPKISTIADGEEGKQRDRGVLAGVKSTEKMPVGLEEHLLQRRLDRPPQANSGELHGR
jgi:hypothetical protein